MSSPIDIKDKDETMKAPSHCKLVESLSVDELLDHALSNSYAQPCAWYLNDNGNVRDIPVEVYIGSGKLVPRSLVCK